MMVETTKAVEYWLPLITAFMGFASSQVLEWVKDHRAYKRERDARDYARIDKQLEERNRFQFQTLLELQETLTKLVRTIGQVHYIDVMNSVSGEKRRGSLPSDLNDREFEANLQTIMLGARVRDDSIRESLKLLESHRAQILLVSDINKSTEMMNCVSKIYDDLNARIGQVLRGLDEIDLAE